jgi:DNA-binding winged helix-turn-helix (wHTH) protein/tetratricopeptide (TPR) repeat protein
MEFDGWTVNRLSGELSRDGRSSRLPQQPLRILIELFDHAGEIVTRDHLVKVLWPAGVVDFDNGLNVAMRKLRVALDDVGDTPLYIETLPRVGYRFMVRPADSKTAPAVPRGRTRRGSIVIAACVAALIAAIAGTWWSGTRAGAQHVPSERAQEFYLEGIHERSRRDIDSNETARTKFEAALREDPQFAQAWAALGENYSVAVIRQEILPAIGISKARAAAQRAIALDDNAVEGHYLLGQIHLDHDKDFAGAKREFDRAMKIDDRSARLWHHYAMWHAQLGHMDESLAALRRARELEPMTPIYAGHYGLVLYEARRYDEAATFLKTLVDANPGFDDARSTFARVLLATGDASGALAQLQARKKSANYAGDLGVVYARLGRRDEALQEIATLEARGREGYGVAYEISTIYTALGDLDEGCDYLARSITDHSLMVNWMRTDPRMGTLRGRQCFADADRKLYGGNH